MEEEEDRETEKAEESEKKRGEIRGRERAKFEIRDVSLGFSFI